MKTTILGRVLRLFLLFGVAVSINAVALGANKADAGTDPNRKAMEKALQAVISGNNTKPENHECQSTEECLKKCPVGYEEDEQGCPDCSRCKAEGTFEGDISVEGQEDLDTVLDAYGAENEGTKRRKRDALKSGLHQWPKTDDKVIIYYEIDKNSLGSALNDRVNWGIAEFHAKTCIEFAGREGQEDYIRFEGGEKCSSHVGKKGGKQVIQLHENCAHSKGTVIHEIMHALGFWHEQSRPDRDDYVEIWWYNIRNAGVNFQIRSRNEWDSFGSPYDIDSIMQYDGYAMAIDPDIPTITNKATYSAVEAQRVGLSIQDIIQINKKYECGVVECEDRTDMCYGWTHLCHSRPALMAYWCPKTCRHC